MSPNASVHEDEDILLEPGRPNHSVARSAGDPMSPTMADDRVLESRPSSSRDVRVQLAARGAAQVRRYEDPMSPSVGGSAFKRARVPDPTSPTVSYESDGGEDASMLSVAMRDHFEGIEVRPDCHRQRLYS